MGSREEWYKSFEKSRKQSDPLLPRATSYINLLSSVVGDRMPAEHEQHPEVERRRVQDVRRDLNAIRDVTIAVIEDLEDVGFMSEEMKEEFKGKKEEDDYQPCKHPKDWYDWFT